MVLRGFNNDGHLSRARSRKPSVKETLAEVISSGKPIRQYLALHEIDYDMTQLQGVPGRVIASAILGRVINHIDSSDPVSDAQNTLRTKAERYLGIVGVSSESTQ